MPAIFIGLGSNLDNPVAQLQQALEALQAHPHIELKQVSAFYQSLPMGPADQADYINAVAELESALEPRALLAALQAIENAQGRVRKQRWGARTLDLDILLYGRQVINEPDLIVPHCGIAERNFVLYPLQELVDADFNIPTHGQLRELLAVCSADGIRQLQDKETSG